MESKISLFSISDSFIAKELTTVDKEFYSTLKQFFRIRESNCQFVICVGHDHSQSGVSKKYDYNFYELLDSNFNSVNKLPGIYELNDYKLVESWAEKWANKSILIKFQSDIYDKYNIAISASGSDKLKIVQQIAIVLQCIIGKSKKMTDSESGDIRIKLDQYLSTKRL
ncbi:hypothetical protein [Ferruginibacter sp. SUN106]|uniref:hypothetical protein n=1 Tax=Ferruginibacter sp. SUN106 TaxID=2978348 RepID=UPI003D368700